MTKLEVKREVLNCLEELGLDEAVRTGIGAFKEEYAKLQREAAKERKDFRLHNTKLLLRHYQELSIHAKEAISVADFSFWEDLMLPDGRVDIKALKMSVAKTRALLRHVDAMLNAYKSYCESGGLETQRRWRCLSAMYLEQPRLSVDDIAKREYMSTRSVYVDIDTACDQLGVYLYGVDAVGELFEAFGPN